MLCTGNGLRGALEEGTCAGGGGREEGRHEEGGVAKPEVRVEGE